MKRFVIYVVYLILFLCVSCQDDMFGTYELTFDSGETSQVSCFSTNFEYGQFSCYHSHIVTDVTTYPSVNSVRRIK